MGGENGGEVASQVTVQTLEAAAVARPLDSVEGAIQLLIHGLRAASERVHALAKHQHLPGMGTTASIATIVGDRMIYGQVGDSRIYVLRNSALYQVTRDQSLAQLLVERGQLREEEVESYPMKNVILQAVGPRPSVDVDVRAVRLGRNDVVLACSDGLFGAIPASLILETLLANPEPEAACGALVDAALAAGANDNVTCVVARIASGPDRTTEALEIEPI